MNIKYLVNYVRTMKCYFYFLILQMLVVASLLIYVFVDYGNNHQDAFIFLVECVLTTIVTGEILLRMASNKKTFFKNIWNILDVIGICVIIALFFILVCFESGDGKATDEDQMIPAFLLSARYIAQLVRILITLKQNHEMRNVAHIDFTLNEPENPNETSVEVSVRDVSF